MTEKLQQFVLPISGSVVTYKSTSPALLAYDIQATNPAPVYKQWVEYGDGRGAWEENRSHPEQAAMTEAWEKRMDYLTFNATILMSVVVTMTPEIKAQVDAVREELGSLGIVLDKSDKLVWFKYVACASDGDWQAFFNHLSGKSEPREEVTRGFQDGFRGDVREPSAVEVPHS